MVCATHWLVAAAIHKPIFSWNCEETHGRARARASLSACTHGQRAAHAGARQSARARTATDAPASSAAHIMCPTHESRWSTVKRRLLSGWPAGIPVGVSTCCAFGRIGHFFATLCEPATAAISVACGRPSEAYQPVSSSPRS